MTVLPVRSTRAALAGGCRSPFLPTQVIESPSTRIAELSITGLLSPTIRRAPSNQMAGRRAWDDASMGMNAAARIAEKESSRRSDISFSLEIGRQLRQFRELISVIGAI